MKVGEVIRTLRKNKKLTQLELCEKIGITQTYLSQLESGEKSNPGKELIFSICDAFDISQVAFLWMCIEEEDVPKYKRKAFLALKPVIDKLLE